MIIVILVITIFVHWLFDLTYLNHHLPFLFTVPNCKGVNKQCALRAFVFKINRCQAYSCLVFTWNKPIQRHLRHSLMLLWFADLMNVTEEVTIHRPNVSTLPSPNEGTRQEYNFRSIIYNFKPSYTLLTLHASWLVWCLYRFYQRNKSRCRCKWDVTVEYLTRVTLKKQLTALHVVRIIIFSSGRCLFSWQKCGPTPKLFLRLNIFSTLVDHIILTYLLKSFIPDNKIK